MILTNIANINVCLKDIDRFNVYASHRVFFSFRSCAHTACEAQHTKCTNQKLFKQHS